MNRTPKRVQERDCAIYEAAVRRHYNLLAIRTAVGSPNPSPVPPASLTPRQIADCKRRAGIVGPEATP